MRLDPQRYDTASPDAVPVGTMFDPVEVGVDRATVIMSAAATNTYFAGHTDTEYARTQNRRDIYLATGAVAGLIDRAIGTWLGPQAFVRTRTFAMRASICAGDQIAIAGAVTAAADAVGRAGARPAPVAAVTVEVTITNQLGETCVRGTVVADLPAAGSTG